MRPALPLLDLSQAPSVLFFYGLSGAGKTHIGQLVSQLSGCFFYDADCDISSAMQQALDAQQPFTEAMRDEYFPRVASNIAALQKKHASLVVTQGTYKQRHRDFLQAAITDIDMICVVCEMDRVQAQLQQRDRGISSASAAALLADFEAPRASEKVLHNRGDDADIVQQLNHWYAQ